MIDANDHVELIREVFRYTQAFQGKTFVLQLDDGILLRDTITSLMRDLVLLHRTGIRIVIAAGARQRIDEILARYNIACEKHRGVRISSPEAIPFIKMAAFDSANRVMTSLSGQGVNAVIGNWVRARSLGVVDGIDFQDAGVVDKIRVDLLRGVIEQGAIPILPCIGWSASGKPYNVSSRQLATELASALQATKLFFLAEIDQLTTARYKVDTDVDRTPEGRISRMTVDQAARFCALNESEAYDLGCELVGLGLQASTRGVERVHIVDGRSDGVVLQEIFSNLGVGTMVHANQYQSIRDMKRSDIPDVLRLMQPLISRGLLVNRTEQDLQERIDDYVVYETDGMVHGCGALHIYDDVQAEIAGLAVDDDYERFGIGQRIVRYLIEGARRAGMQRVFVLTTQASDWFEQLGFRSGSVNDIAPGKQQRYDHARKSRVLLYDVSSVPI
jgi:amino-acid N-acetyltransferase